VTSQVTFAGGKNSDYCFKWQRGNLLYKLVSSTNLGQIHMSIVVTLLEGNYYKLVYYTLIYYLLLSLDPLPPSLSMLEETLSLKRHGGWKSTTVEVSYVEESIANKISISNKILGIGENQPSTSSTSRAENEMGTSSQLPSTAKSSQPQVPNSLPKIIVKNCTNCKVDVHIGKNSFF
jgi:hypothetical protein